jgi:hypothetical protein
LAAHQSILSHHKIFCPIESCKELLTLNDIGGLSEFFRHLKRHKSPTTEQTQASAIALPDRWSEIRACGLSEVDVPVGLYLLRRHDRMICLDTLERRKENYQYNVLMTHKQNTLGFQKNPRNVDISKKAITKTFKHSIRKPSTTRY